jgi:hypothetical protein
LALSNTDVDEDEDEELDACCSSSGSSRSLIFVGESRTVCVEVTDGCVLRRCSCDVPTCRATCTLGLYVFHATRALNMD